MALKKSKPSLCGLWFEKLFNQDQWKPQAYTTRSKINFVSIVASTLHTEKRDRRERCVFIGDIFRLLKDTTWPTRKESWRDFRSIMEYTAFFVVIIYIF